MRTSFWTVVGVLLTLAMIVLSAFINYTFGYSLGTTETNAADANAQEQYVGHVKITDAAPDPRDADAQSLLKRLRVGEVGRISSQPDKDFGGIGKAKAMQGKPRERIAGDMIDENKQQCDAAKEIDAQIPPFLPCRVIKTEHNRWRVGSTAQA